MTFFKNYFKNYNTPGGIKELLVLALPMVISTSCDGIMTFTDRLFLARVGPEHMNAAMGGGVTMQALTFFFIGLTGYSTALVAQFLGAGERSNSSITAFQAVLVTLFAWPVILLLKPLAVMFFHSTGVPASQLEYQVQYLHILALGSVFMIMRHTLGCYFTGIGRTGVVMRATIMAMVVNVVLDYILIFGKLGFPALGVRGAAIATVSGAFFAVLVLLLSFFSHGNRTEFSVAGSFHFNWPIMKKLLYFGYPAGVELFLNFLAFALMVSMFYSRGDVVATASTIMFNWDLVSFIPLLGIEIAVTSLVGRYMGARQPEVAHYSAISGIKTGLLYSVTVLVFFISVPEFLVRVFRPESFSSVFEEAVPIAVSMVRIASLYVLAEAAMAAVVGALRGAGDTHFTMLASVSAHWLFIPVLYISIHVLELSIVISWLIMVVCFLFFCGALLLRFRSGKWKNIMVVGK